MTGAVVSLDDWRAEHGGGLQLNTEQRSAVALVRKLAKSKAGRAGKTVIVAGPAGTGKTTLLEALGALGILIATPTGKAAVRVTEKTGLPACTIHRLIYDPRETVDGAVEFDPKTKVKIERKIRAIVVDEASMLSRKLYDDLLRVAQSQFLLLVLVGDPHQLPPVAPGEPPFSIFANVDCQRVDLTQVIRQAKGSIVLRAATLVREHRVDEGLSLLPTVDRLNVVQAAADMARSGGIVIVAKNETRHWLNREIRKRHGWEGGLEGGEPLLVTRTNYDLGLFNGEVVISEGAIETSRLQPQGGPILTFASTVLDGVEAKVCLEDLSGQMSDVTARGLRLGGFVRANYGYAVTCHKCQGSEWPRALVVLDRETSSDEGRRFLYTALTRAKVEVVLCYGRGYRR